VIKRWFELKTASPDAARQQQVIELVRKLAKAFWHQADGHPFATNHLVNLKAVAGAEWCRSDTLLCHHAENHHAAMIDPRCVHPVRP
jgi:hypothetical protein